MAAWFSRNHFWPSLFGASSQLRQTRARNLIISKEGVFALKVPSSRSQPLRSFAMVFIGRVLSGHQLSAMTATTKSYLHIIFRQGARPRQLRGGPSRTTEAQTRIAHPPSSFVSFVWAAGFSPVLPPFLNMTTSAFSKPTLHMFHTTKSYLRSRRVTVL
jgi:hypothetical protein